MRIVYTDQIDSIGALLVHMDRYFRQQELKLTQPHAFPLYCTNAAFFEDFHGWKYGEYGEILYSASTLWPSVFSCLVSVRVYLLRERFMDYFLV